MKAIIISLSLAFLLFASTNVVAQKKHQITEITHEQNSSWQGFMYKYVLRSDGAATLYGPNGNAETPRKLAYHGHFAEFERAAKFVTAQRFFSLDRRYEAEEFDASTVIVGVVRNGKRREVIDYGTAGPANLRAIEDLIRSLAEKIKWDARSMIWAPDHVRRFCIHLCNS